MENEEDRKQKKTEKTPSHARWVIRVFLIAVALSASMSLCSGAVLEDAGYVTATLILLLFIALGIMFIGSLFRVIKIRRERSHKHG